MPRLLPPREFWALPGMPTKSLLRGPAPRLPDPSRAGPLTPKAFSLPSRTIPTHSPWGPLLSSTPTLSSPQTSLLPSLHLPGSLEVRVLGGHPVPPSLVCCCGRGAGLVGRPGTEGKLFTGREARPALSSSASPPGHSTSKHSLWLHSSTCLVHAPASPQPGGWEAGPGPSQSLHRPWETFFVQHQAW